MTSLTASAPGKIVLLGEYAVLSGATALVAAVNRRARVRLMTTDEAAAPEPSGQPGQPGPAQQPKPTAHPRWTVDSPSLGITGATATVTPAGHIRWDSDLATDQLGLVSTVLAALHRDGLAPSAKIELDTHELHAEQPDAAPDAAQRTPPTKLGLGSSAALTVALAGALAAAANGAALRTEDLLRTHRRLQDGHGSGIDVAAAVHGGLLRFTPGPQGPTVEAVTLPPALSWCCVWTGRPASTRDFLTRIAAWRAREPDRHDGLMDLLAQTSAAGVDAVHQQDAAAFLSAVDSYAVLLSELGTASGADIVCAEHRALASIAETSGVSYKSCGAGGGDIGVALTTEPDRLDRFRELAQKAGFHPLALTVDPLGFSVQSDPN